MGKGDDVSIVLCCHLRLSLISHEFFFLHHGVVAFTARWGNNVSVLCPPLGFVYQLNWKLHERKRSFWQKSSIYISICVHFSLRLPSASQYVWGEGTRSLFAARAPEKVKRFKFEYYILSISQSSLINYEQHKNWRNHGQDMWKM